jgi:putative ABC transport system permease protein
MLVVFQAALAVVLLAATGLMVRSFEQLQKIDLGFDPTGKVKVVISFPRGYELQGEPRLQLFERLRDRLRSIPGVKDVAAGQDALLIGGIGQAGQLLMKDGTLQPVDGTWVSAHYQKAAGLVLKEGRWFSGKRGILEAVINETMAHAFFGDEDPIGRSFKIHDWGDAAVPVVGVVHDVRASVRASDGMHFYMPDWMRPTNVSTLVLRLDRDPDEIFASVIRRAIYEVDPKLIATQVASIHELEDLWMGREHFAFGILKWLSAIALVLAAAGLFSVITYSVDSRMREFGVRIALGATPDNLRRLVLRRGLAVATAGVGLGIAGALALTRFMQSLLFETKPYDPLVYLAVAVVLLVAAGAASWLPARRAARVNVALLLRAE